MLRALRRFLAPSRPPAPIPASGPDALVQVYHRGETFYVEPLDRTRVDEAGYWIATGEVTALAAGTSDAALGEVALRALARSRVAVPVPPRDAKLEAGLFRAMGVRSRRTAMSGTRSCMLSREPRAAELRNGPATPALLRIEALYNGGTRGDGRGYRGLAEPAVVELPLESDATAVGQAVREALQRACIAPQARPGAS